jgi:hypothetical protein
MTPARRAYMQMHPSVNVPGASPTDYIPPAIAAAPDAAAKDDSAVTAPPAENPAANANPDPASNLTPPTVDASPGMSQRPIPSTQDTNSAPVTPGNVNDQITNMEKMFQQRIQINQNQNAQQPQ